MYGGCFCFIQHTPSSEGVGTYFNGTCKLTQGVLVLDSVSVPILDNGPRRK